MMGEEPAATGYRQCCNKGTGTTLMAPAFDKYTGSTCAAVEEAICAVAEL